LPPNDTTSSSPAAAGSWGVYAWVPFAPWLAGLVVGPVTADNRPVAGRHHPRRNEVRLMTPGPSPLTEAGARESLKQIRKDAIDLRLWLYPNVGAIWLYPAHDPRPATPRRAVAMPGTGYAVTGRDQLAPAVLHRRDQGGMLIQVVTDNNRYFDYEMGKTRLLLDQFVAGFGHPTYASPAAAREACIGLARKAIELQPPGPVVDMLLGRLLPLAAP
jgi:hypothetical protein